MWHEALTTRDPELVNEVFMYKEQMRLMKLVERISARFGQFEQVNNALDFFIKLTIRLIRLIIIIRLIHFGRSRTFITK